VRDLATVTTSTVDSATVVRVDGEIDCSNALDVLGHLGESLPSDASLLVIDLTACGYLDSAGIREVLKLHQHLRARRQELALVIDPTGAVHRVLAIVGALDHVHWYDSLAAAVGATS
jgi:anti-anti-sigma factor